MALLDGLDDVPWHRLSHAYGPASDVPGLLRDLASPDGKVRGDAMYNLYGNIWHQGTVYEATAYAVPFLLELLQDESVADRREILVLLVHLANGHSYWDVHQHLEMFDKLYPSRKGSAEFKEEIARELGWVAAAYRAVRDGSPIYLRLLEHPDAVLREAAAYVLAGLFDQSAFDAVVPGLLARLERETEDGARASLIHGIGLQVRARMARALLPADEERRYVDLFAQHVRSGGESDLVRLVAAMALANVAPGSTAHAKLAAARLLSMLVDRNEQLAQRYGQLPWAEGDVAGEVCTCLAGLDPAIAGSAIIPALLRALAAADGFTALSIAQALLHIAFRSVAQSGSVDLQHLTPEQRAVLEVLANENCPCWKINVNMANLLRAYGLPDWPDKLQAALAL